MEKFYQDTVSNWSFVEDSTISFLLLCLYPSKNKQISEKIQRVINDGVLWDRLIELAKVHYVLPLLYRRLHSVCPEQVPADTLKEMHRFYQGLVVQNLLSTKELTNLLQVMAAHGVDATPYKGPILAHALYDEVDLRQFGDLDIIIKPDDMHIVEKLLIERGYRHYFGQKTEAELRAYMRNKAEHTYDFYHDAKGLLVEVHWRFWPVYFSFVNPCQVWDRRQKLTFNGTATSTFAIEDYLLILCMHGSRHAWSRLSWLCDVAMLLHKYPDLDWSYVLTQASEWRCKRMLFLGLYLTYHWFGESLPPHIIQTISADKKTAFLAKVVDQRVFRLNEISHQMVGMTQYQLQVRECLRDKVVYFESLLYWLKKGH